MERGKFIVIEGIDGSGKTTQLELLEKKIKSLKLKIKTVDFPRYYDSRWGKAIGEFLAGKFGKFKDIDPHLAAPLYMIDQYIWSRDIGRPWIEFGGNVLSNRYFTSNVHQVAKLKGKAKIKFRNWIWPAGYIDLKILRPDLVLFLDVTPKVALQLNKTKKARKYLNGKKEDEAEKDRMHQRLSYVEYQNTIKRKQNSYWKKVVCETKKGELDSAEKIHNRIWSIVSKYIK